MEKEQRCTAKRQMIALMQAGHPWQEAAAMAGLRIGRSAAYQLLQKVRTRGEAGGRVLCEPNHCGWRRNGR